MSWPEAVASAGLLWLTHVGLTSVAPVFAILTLFGIARSRFWWLLINLTIIGGLVTLVFNCLTGTPGPNKYGDDPLRA